MKVLVVSLLRVGDLICHNELIGRVAKEHPLAEIHVLSNDFTQGVAACLPLVKKWHFFPRQYLQDILVQRIQRPEKAELVLEELIQSLNAENFDLLLNLTHNKQSVVLVSQLTAKEKRGNQFGLSTKLGRRWSVYLNEVLATQKSVPFQLIDALCASLGFATSSSRRLRPAAVDRVGICFQVLTSDAKKNWPLKNWVELIKKISLAFPNKPLRVLCAPQEQDLLSAALQDVKVSLEAQDFVNTQRLLAKSELLITGDTSIQHLAAGVGCPLLCLFIGSADPSKTAPYCDDAYILKSLEVCQPCWHSEACFREEHFCAKNIKVETVFTLSDLLLRHQTISGSETYGVELYRTQLRSNRLVVHCLSSQAHEVGSSFEREVWAMALGQSFTQAEGVDISPMGFAAHRWLVESLDDKKIPSKLVSKFLASQQGLMDQYDDRIARVQSIIREISKKCLGKSSPSVAFEVDCLKKEIVEMQNVFPAFSFFSLELCLLQNQLSLVHTNAFVLLSRLKPALDFIVGIGAFRRSLVAATGIYLLERGKSDDSRETKDLS